MYIVTYPCISSTLCMLDTVSVFSLSAVFVGLSLSKTIFYECYNFSHIPTHTRSSDPYVSSLLENLSHIAAHVR